MLKNISNFFYLCSLIINAKSDTIKLIASYFNSVKIPSEIYNEKFLHIKFRTYTLSLSSAQLVQTKRKIPILLGTRLVCHGFVTQAVCIWCSELYFAVPAPSKRLQKPERDVENIISMISCLVLLCYCLVWSKAILCWNVGEIIC